jgi:hypothetical protein
MPEVSVTLSEGYMAGGQIEHASRAGEAIHEDDPRSVVACYDEVDDPPAGLRHMGRTRYRALLRLGQTNPIVYDAEMPRTRTAPESALATLPTLSQMVRDGQADTIQHGRRTRETLEYWFRQSERLNIARSHYGLRGARFTDFARRIGVDRASAFRLIKLHKHRGAVLSECRDELAKATALRETYESALSDLWTHNCR